MKDSLFGFKDDKEREEFIIVIPVLLFFAWLVYYLLGDSTPGLDSTNTTVVATATATAADIDGDGVVDSEDRCTVTAGSTKNFGCPAKVSLTQQDADGDGIANSQDNCPNTRGSVANNGCSTPGKNSNNNLVGNNSITDATGTDLTAVDTDEDSVNDLRDQCPTLAGSADNNGCPVDTDGDTIADAEDRCPALAGVAANLGCPLDDDKDGVYNSVDNCPDVAGHADSGGCPVDTDTDGVSDADDQCPDLPGLNLPGSATNGCPPDADGDKVGDAADLCPDQPGTIDLNGCPAVTETISEAVTERATPAATDSDGDGIADSSDRCPTRPGESRFQGCPPDTDADGVSDADDQCPDAQGSVDNNGCPAAPVANAATDTDGDGVADAVDQCPTIAGVSTDGCPIDSDGDGVADADDKCNGVVGTIELLGCSPATARTQPASPGISVADQRILDEAVAQVGFNSSSATLTGRSQEILREIAALLKKYPSSFLEISGHTDSTGPARRNMDLSMQRARACASFIASEGITLDRLFAYGYGESQPITSNATLAGRQLNRRVEFNLKFP